MFPPNEAHCDDFEDHFNAEDDEKNSVKHLNNGIGLLKTRVLKRQANAVGKDSQQDKSVEPLIENNMHDRTEESTRNCESAKRSYGIALCLVR